MKTYLVGAINIAAGIAFLASNNGFQSRFVGIGLIAIGIAFLLSPTIFVIILKVRSRD